MALALMRAGIRVAASDADSALCALWDSIANEPERLKERVLLISPTITGYREQIGLLDHLDRVVSGAAKLAVHQMSYSGLGVMAGSPIGGWKQEERADPPKYNVGCRWSTDSLLAKIDQLHPLLLKYLIDQTVRCEPFERALARSHERAGVYLDPPYYGAGRALYLEQVDHHALARALREEPRPWVLSYDDCPEVRALYEGMRIEQVDVSYTLTSKRKTNEVLIFNFENTVTS